MLNERALIELSLSETNAIPTYDLQSRLATVVVVVVVVLVTGSACKWENDRRGDDEDIEGDDTEGDGEG